MLLISFSLRPYHIKWQIIVSSRNSCFTYFHVIDFPQSAGALRACCTSPATSLRNNVHCCVCLFIECGDSCDWSPYHWPETTRLWGWDGAVGGESLTDASGPLCVCSRSQLPHDVAAASIWRTHFMLPHTVGSFLQPLRGPGTPWAQQAAGQFCLTDLQSIFFKRKDLARTFALTSLSTGHGPHRKRKR
jgi:hypothetical protein